MKTLLQSYIENDDIYEIYSYSNGKGNVSLVHLKNEKKHNVDDFPAVSETYHGKKKSERWYKDGIPHREEGKPVIVHYRNENVKKEVYYEGGKKLYTHEYHPNGILKKAKLFKGNGEVTELTYYPNEKPRHLKKMIDGKIGSSDPESPSFIKYDENGFYTKHWLVNGTMYIRLNNEPNCIDYYPNDNVMCKHWLTSLSYMGVNYMECSFPTKIWYYEDGTIYQKEWRYNSSSYKRADNLPQIINYRRNGSVELEEWYGGDFANRIVREKKYGENGEFIERVILNHHSENEFDMDILLDEFEIGSLKLIGYTVNNGISSPQQYIQLENSTRYLSSLDDLSLPTPDSTTLRLRVFSRALQNRPQEDIRTMILSKFVDANPNFFTSDDFIVNFSFVISQSSLPAFPIGYVFHHIRINGSPVYDSSIDYDTPYYRRYGLPDANNLDNILQESFNQQVNRPQLAPLILTSRKASDLNVVNETCPITQEDFEADDEVVKLKCTHVFKKDSITEWSKVKNTCPCCRAKIEQ